MVWKMTTLCERVLYFKEGSTIARFQKGKYYDRGVNRGVNRGVSSGASSHKSDFNEYTTRQEQAR